MTDPLDGPVASRHVGDAFPGNRPAAVRRSLEDGDAAWAAVEAIYGAHVEPRLRVVKNRVGQRRGRKIGRVAAARHLLILVFYALRDGELRCLATDAA
jgi:hypothetical protein